MAVGSSPSNLKRLVIVVGSGYKACVKIEMDRRGPISSGLNVLAAQDWSLLSITCREKTCQKSENVCHFDLNTVDFVLENKSIWKRHAKQS